MNLSSNLGIKEWVMHLSQFSVLFLLSLALAGCRSEVSAQAVPDAKATVAPVKAPANATTPNATSNGLAISISCIESSDVNRGSKSQQLNYLPTFSPDDPHLNVLLRNVSAQPISVHQEWNSWGYFNLSLELTKINGDPLAKPIIVKREGGQWTKNFAQAQAIQPGESIVREVHFLPADGKKLRAFMGGEGGFYLHFPKPSLVRRNGGIGPDIYTMRAVFQDSSSDNDQDAPPAWTGKVASPPMEYVFR